LDDYIVITQSDMPIVQYCS